MLQNEAHARIKINQINKTKDKREKKQGESLKEKGESKLTVPIVPALQCLI